MKRRWKPVLIVLAALIVAALSFAFWNTLSHRHDEPASLDEISSDPAVLYVELPTDDGMQVTWMLHPATNPSTWFETETEDHKEITRYTASIVETTATAYRVRFQCIVTRSGVTATPTEQSVTFPFGQLTDARLFGLKDISGFYGNPTRKRP